MKKNTTVAISCKHDQILTQLCLQADVSKKEYLEKGMEYFQRFGINPVEFEAPSDEIKKLIKKLDQVIAFIRKQETDILKPACMIIQNNGLQLSQQISRLDNLVDNKSIKDETKLIISNYKVYTAALIKSIDKAKEQEKQAILILAQAIEHKDKTGLGDRIKRLLE